jgi:hypothetical protein
MPFLERPSFAHCHPSVQAIERPHQELRMNRIHQVCPGRRRRAGPTHLLLIGFLIGLRPLAAAHDLFTNYVQHSVHLTVGARHLDLTLDLTFFEEWSARERRTMDADGNGHIGRAERDAYLKQRGAELFRHVKLRVAGRELPLAPLYDPEVDLLANDQTGSGHHRLRLFFFAPTPTLRADDEIVVEDRLWPEAKVLGSVQAEGHDGCTLTTEIKVNPRLLPARTDEVRWFKFRCLQPPTANPATQKTAASNPPRPTPQPRLPPKTLPPHTTQTVP